MGVRSLRLFVLLLAGACSNGPAADGTDETDSNPDPITLDNILERYGDVTCAQTTRCAATYGPVFETEAQCQDAIAGLTASFGRYLDPDLYDFDADAAQTCLDAIDDTCDLPFAGPPEVCFAVFTGKLQEDDCCDEREGCAEGLYCFISAAGPTGTCQPFGTATASCAGNLECAANLYCNASEQCAQRVAQGNTCTSTEECNEGLFCEPPGAGPRTCQPLRANGDGCADDYQCESQACVNNDCSGQRFAGDTCRTDDDQCAFSTDCVAPTPGGLDGTCEPRARAGQPCDASGVTNPPCAAYGLVCNASGQCETGPTGGESCTDERLCYSPLALWCAESATPGEYSCLARIDDGDPCETGLTDAGCMPGSTCRDSECAPLTDPDAPLCP